MQRKETMNSELRHTFVGAHCSAPNPSDSSDQSDQAGGSRTAPKIAVFSSSDDIALRITEALILDGFDPVWATMDDQAREILREEPLDILVCSADMPYFAEARRRNPRIKIICLTADGLPPGYLVCRKVERHFRHDAASARDIVAACRLIAQMKRGER